MLYRHTAVKIRPVIVGSMNALACTTLLV